MNLDEAQKKTVAGWIAEGLRLSDIQKRLSADWGLNLTYMEVRFLVDDLKLTPKDIEPAKPAELGGSPAAAPGSSKAGGPAGKVAGPVASAVAPESGSGEVSVSVDQIARPGTVVSGKVTFSDGNKAEWYLDQAGRLGLMPTRQGYRPSQEDVMDFQTELQDQLAKLGF
jgi:hypothetical protein